MLLEIWQVVLAGLGAMVTGAGGGIAAIWFRSRSQKRRDTAEARRAEIDVDKIQDEFYRESIRSAYSQLSDVQKILDNVREELRNTTQRLAQVELENVKLKEQLKAGYCMRYLQCLDMQHIDEEYT
jgi:hypothetical protein